MAFSRKLTNTLTDAADIARADGADMFAFMMKGRDKHAIEATSIGNTDDPVILFCMVSTLINTLEITTGMKRRKIWKLVEKGVKTQIKNMKRGTNGREIADLD